MPTERALTAYSFHKVILRVVSVNIFLSFTQSQYKYLLFILWENT